MICCDRRGDKDVEEEEELVKVEVAKGELISSFSFSDDVGDWITT